MITIGIAAYKEANTIRRAIENILSQKIKEPFEIIVACPDKETAEVVRELMKKNKKIKLIKERKREGQPAAYNKIMKAAKGRIIIFTDADAVLEKGSINKIINTFKDKNVGAAGGRPKPLNKRGNMFGFWAHFLFEMAHKLRMDLAKRGEFYYITGPLCAIRKGIINRMPKNAMATDIVLGYLIKRKGYKVVYVPSAVVYQKAPTTFKDYFAQKIRTMAGFYQFKKMFNVKPVRSMTREGKYVKYGFKFAKGIKEKVWFLELLFFRTIAWALAWWNLNIKKKDIAQIWKPVVSTK
jgi:biofilm PGA synthesis N-glycosyltransferase PgaC